MTTPTIANLEKLLGGPRDGALLRYSLGNEWLKAGDPARAAGHFREAVGLDPRYSAAWKQLGKALEAIGDLPAALEAFRQGVSVATARGDVQASREMAVFAKRVAKRMAPPAAPRGDS
ncbi:tetratricopeptide repeat protein [Propionivibrio sp.]|uniref:tetratricopeptide repeat protein n=1 Tax=Propionivibrio sp. TaxID=2212460 RepID=UPI0039E3FEF4